MQAQFISQAISLVNTGVLSAKSLYLAAIGQTVVESPLDNTELMASRKRSRRHLLPCLMNAS